MYRHGHSNYVIRVEAAYPVVCSEVLRVGWVGLHVQDLSAESVLTSVPQRGPA